MKEKTFSAKVDNLHQVQDFVREELMENHCPAKNLTAIELAVEEIFVNISLYAYSPDSGSVIVRVSCDSEARVEFEDKGVEFNPLLRAEPVTPTAVIDRIPGGQGIHMVRRLMDAVEYERVDGRNRLILRKKIKRDRAV